MGMRTGLLSPLTKNFFLHEGEQGLQKNPPLTWDDLSCQSGGKEGELKTSREDDHAHLNSTSRK